MAKHDKKINGLDRIPSTEWALAPSISAGLIVGYAIFDLFNERTRRAHQLHIPLGGFSAHFNTSGNSEADYTSFETSKPVHFGDFDGKGVRITSLNLGIVWGYSWTAITIYQDSALCSNVLASILLKGWGAMALPGGSIMAHGVSIVHYGSGNMMGKPYLPPIPPSDNAPSRIPEGAPIEIDRRKKEIRILESILFDFDSSTLTPTGRKALSFVANSIRRATNSDISIEGHTDSIGTKQYNYDLSIKRATAVKLYLISKGVRGAKNFKVKGYGETKPTAPNRLANGRDNPKGRKANRRVVIRLDAL